MKRRSLLALLAVLTTAASAQAQSTKEFSTVRFYPSLGAGSYIGLDGAAVGDHRVTSYGALLDFSANTLTIDNPCDGIKHVSPACANQTTNFVHSTGLLHLTTSLSLHKRTQIGFDLPLGFTDTTPFSTQVDVSSGNPTRTVQPHQGFAFADSRVSAKTRIWSTANDELRFAATVFTTLPTAMLTSNGSCRNANTCSYLGERGVQAGGYGIAEFARGDFSGAVNVGVAYRPERKFLTVDTGTEITYGVAGQYAITPLLLGKAEVVGAASVHAKDYPLEARAQIAYGEDLQFKLGGGAGVVGEVGVPNYRLFAGAQWIRTSRDGDRDGIDDREDACPSDSEDRDGFMDDDGCPDVDNDGDGILDPKDSCVDQREDKDGFADDDGCPDEDNDGDGVPDGYDSCEGAKEDVDGDRDDDGCPDLDVDRDGVRDDLDKCPNQPEDSDDLGDDDGCPEADFDGDEVPDEQDACPDAAESWNDLLDQDGCPEDDEDNDGVPDQLDQCPDHAETLNGKSDQDGCPDGAMMMVLQGQRLLPTATAQFDGNTLHGASFLVEAITGYIKANHKRGSLRVVFIAPASDTKAAERAKELAAQIHKRSGRVVTSAHIPGQPPHLEIELLSPGISELPRPKTAVPAAQPTPPAAAATPAAPAPVSSAAGPQATPAPTPAASPAAAAATAATPVPSK